MNDANVIYQRSRLEHTRKKFLSLDLPPLNGKRYLDLGCNAGAFCEFALEEGARQVGGVDIDPKLVEIARERLPTVEFFIYRFEEMDLGSREYDIITIASAIHYSQEFLVVAERIFRYLAPDGLLVVEGGLFDPMGNTMLNTPVPNWRLIGDHCRHLSMNFVSEVLFPSSDVRLVGPSLQQDGDNLSRYALHVARNYAECSMAKRSAHVDLEGFIRALAISHDTVHKKYSISNHMGPIKRSALLGPGEFDSLLAAGPEVLDIIVSEVLYCVSDWASEVVLRDCYGSETGRHIVERLKGKGMPAELTT